MTSMLKKKNPEIKRCTTLKGATDRQFLKINNKKRQSNATLIVLKDNNCQHQILYTMHMSLKKINVTEKPFQVKKTRIIFHQNIQAKENLSGKRKII